MSFVDSLYDNFDRDEEPPVEEPVPAPVQAEPPAPAPLPVTTPSSEPAPPAPVAQPQAPAPVQQPAPVTQPAATPPVTQPVAQPSAQPAAPQPGQTATQQVEPGKELEVLRQGLEAQRENFVKAAAQSYLPTFTDQDIEAIQGSDTGAAKQTMATMAARLHADIAQNILGMISAQLPTMISRMQQVQSQHQRATEDFYTQYPDLKSHSAQVTQIAAGLRQAYPQMPQDQFIPLVVNTARQMAGVAPAVQPTQQPPQQRVVHQAPFQPVPARAPAAPRGPAPGQNQWSFMTEILQAEDNGAFEPR
jgi:hypothetical protein